MFKQAFQLHKRSKIRVRSVELETLTTDDLSGNNRERVAKLPSFFMSLRLSRPPFSPFPSPVNGFPHSGPGSLKSILIEPFKYSPNRIPGKVEPSLSKTRVNFTWMQNSSKNAAK
jgi:hypothetical protein